jgi:hypothetical protein
LQVSIFPKDTFKFHNSLKRLTELIETYYIHDYYRAKDTLKPAKERDPGGNKMSARGRKQKACLL